MPKSPIQVIIQPLSYDLIGRWRVNISVKSNISDSAKFCWFTLIFKGKETSITARSSLQTI
jgi:hypothetical protein